MKAIITANNSENYFQNYVNLVRWKGQQKIKSVKSDVNEKFEIFELNNISSQNLNVIYQRPHSMLNNFNNLHDLKLMNDE